jgi:hypothetical protein
MIKKLTAKANTKSCEELAAWIQSVANHLWWCAATCNGDATLLKEKWVSLLHHVTNTHRWTGNTEFHKCGHKRLTAAKKKKTKWLKKDSQAYKALQDIVTSKTVMKDLPNLTRFCHTGEIEVFHSMLLKYCSKRQHFGYNAMNARLMLAALDWNSQSREEVRDAEGEVVLNTVYSKRRKQWVLKTRYKKTSRMAHVPALIARVLQVETSNLRHKLIPMKQPANMPSYVARVPKPERSAMIMKSRFTT